MSEIEDNYLDYYVVESGTYIFYVKYIPSDRPPYSLDAVEIEINENNYLRLFPYDTMKEYKEANNFGRITEYDSDKINYKNYNTVYNEIFAVDPSLIFNNGLLHKIRFYYFDPYHYDKPYSY